MKLQLKVSEFKNVNDFIFWSMISEVFFILVGGVFGSVVLVANQPIAQRMLELTITLDGVLFGFSAAMISFLFRESESKKMSESRLKSSLFYALMGFYSYIFSIIISFGTMATLERQSFIFSVFTPIWLTIFGAIFTSMYLILLFIEEIFPESPKTAEPSE